jgi:hypothetical protein
VGATGSGEVLAISLCAGRVGRSVELTDLGQASESIRVTETPEACASP